MVFKLSQLKIMTHGISETSICSAGTDSTIQLHSSLLQTTINAYTHIHTLTQIPSFTITFNK